MVAGRLVARSRALNARVNAHVETAEASVRLTAPLVSYMSSLRRAGVAVFILVLVASAALISPAVAVGFALISASASAFSAVDALLRSRKLQNLARLR